MPLAGDQNRIARLRPRNDLLNRATPIQLDLVGIRTHRLVAFLDLGRDLGGLFLARVVARDEREICELRRDPPHLRALAGIAITAAAERQQHAALRDFAQRRQHVLQGVVRVRVVHEHTERLPGRNHLQPARDRRQRIERGLDFYHVNLQRETRADGGQRVVNVMAANERQADGKLALGRFHHETRTVGVQLNLRRAQAGLLTEAIGQLDLQALGLIRQPGTEAVIDVDDRCRALAPLRQGCEQPFLRREITLHRPVIIEMVTGQVREDADIELDAVDPLLVERMRAHFHHARLAVRLQHLRHHLVNLDGFRRGALRGNHAIANLVTHGAHQAGLDVRRFKDRLDHEGDGRLAVRSRDANDLQLRARVLVIGSRGAGHRFTHVGHLNLRDPSGNELAALADDRARTALDRRADELVTIDVLTGDGDKHHAGSHPTRVVGDPRHLAISRTIDDGGGQALNELPEEHGRRPEGHFAAYDLVEAAMNPSGLERQEQPVCEREGVPFQLGRRNWDGLPPRLCLRFISREANCKVWMRAVMVMACAPRRHSRELRWCRPPTSHRANRSGRV